jgi:hypothetical protein
MDNPEQPRKPRWFVRWFSPLRWGFWTLTLPALSILTISILFTWPGLEYSWKLDDRWLIQRRQSAFHHRDGRYVEGDEANLRTGPLEIERSAFAVDGKLYAPLSVEGFYARNDTSMWLIGYNCLAFHASASFDKFWVSW